MVSQHVKLSQNIVKVLHLRMDGGSTSPMLHLDLDNFDLPEAECSRYVLTSPRSLESCARLGVKPVDLLFKPLTEFIDENENTLFETVTALYEAYEKKRRERLRLCREERERIMKENINRRPSIKPFSGLETVLEQAAESQSTDSKYRACLMTVKSRSEAELTRQRHSAVGFRKHVGNAGREAAGSRPTRSCQLVPCSFSLGDLRHSPATERQLARLTQDIQRGMRVTVPQRDRKIAALMLVKHEEKQFRLQHRHLEQQQREEAQKQEEERRARTECQRRKELFRSIQRWHERLETRRRQRELEEAKQAGQREQRVRLQEDRWRRLAEEQESRRRERAKAAKKEAEERKRNQEMLLKETEQEGQAQRQRELHLAQVRELQAKWSKKRLERREKRRLLQENQREQLRHLLLKRQVEQLTEAEEAQKRSVMEWRLRRSGENRAQVEEARLQELRERSAREEERAMLAQRRAHWHGLEQQQQRLALVGVSQQRAEQAARYAQRQQSHAAQRAKRHNQERELSHQRLREHVQQEEEARWVQRRDALERKECRRERLQKEREEAKERSRKVALASFHMRDRIRQETCIRTFDQMAAEALLTANLGRLTL